MPHRKWRQFAVVNTDCLTSVTYLHVTGTWRFSSSTDFAVNKKEPGVNPRALKDSIEIRLDTDLEHEHQLVVECAGVAAESGVLKI